MRVLSSAGWSTRVHLPLLGAGASAKPTAGGVSPRRRDRDWPRTQKRRAGTERRNSTAGPHLHDPPRPGQPAAASPRHSPATASLSQPAPPSSRATYSVLKWAAKSRSSIQKTPSSANSYRSAASSSSVHSLDPSAHAPACLIRQPTSRRGRRCCSQSSEHRVNTTEKKTVRTAEYGRIRGSSRALVGRHEPVFCF